MGIWALLLLLAARVSRDRLSICDEQQVGTSDIDLAEVGTWILKMILV